LFLVLVLPSSQMSIAGSVAIRFSRLFSEPSALARSISICPCWPRASSEAFAAMRRVPSWLPAPATFVYPVAK
jgi:hypothetical protein